MYQHTDEEALRKRLAQGPITLYCGFDPTADSLAHWEFTAHPSSETVSTSWTYTHRSGRRRNGINW